MAGHSVVSCSWSTQQDEALIQGWIEQQVEIMQSEDPKRKVSFLELARKIPGKDHSQAQKRLPVPLSR